MNNNISNDEVLFEEKPGKGGDIGLITLNRPEALNALTYNMILALHHQLRLWKDAKQIKAVVIRAEGRAFCAGGDLKSAYERIKAGDESSQLFFRDEYELNRFIFHFPKPYIALLDGITMGGGVGISLHGSHRVATENLLFAMPETGIGFFPDVGGTYFLPRLPDKMGYYLGLSGARINSDECVAWGLATHKVAKQALSSLIDALAQEAFRENAKIAVSHILEQFTIPHHRTALLDHQKEMSACFSENTIEAILLALQQSSNTDCQQVAALLLKKSPASLKITLRALQTGTHLDFDDCKRQEYRLVCRFLKGHDFPEGIRAVIIDKDQAPRWQPPILAQVSEKEIESYFLS